MTLDPKLVEALNTEVASTGQSEALGRLLAAWLDAVTSGNEDLNDVSAADRHIELIYGEVSLEPAEVDESDEDDLVDEREDA